MTKDCDEESKKVSVSFPAEVAERLGVGSVSLNDASCQAVETGPRWTLQSHSTACGSTALTYGDAPMYRNNLIVKFDQGPLSGQETKYEIEGF